MAPRHLIVLICMAMMLAFTGPGAAQPHPVLHGLHINVGMGSATPDRRLQSWPGLDSFGQHVRDIIRDNNNHSNDDWLQIVIEKRIELGRNMSVSPGVGYARWRGDFPNFMTVNPAIFILEFAGRHTSHNYMVSLPTSLNIFGSGRLGAEIGINPILLMNCRTVLFGRGRTSGPPNFSTSAFGIHSVSFNPYVRLRFQRLYLMGSFRAYHLKWPERAPVSRFQNKVDAHNPFAVFVSLGFDIFGSGKSGETPKKGDGADASKGE